MQAAGSVMICISEMSLARPKMTRTHVLLRCPALEDARRKALVDNTTGAFTRPSSIGTL
jgi:hypothetical protein